MEYYENSVIPIIESNYNKFTNVEKMIADFFINNQKKQDFSAKTIAEQLFISEASLSRFAKKCGFKGYREFIFQYEGTFVEKTRTIKTNTKIVLNAYQELLNRTYSLVDEAQLARISKYISDAKRVIVCGKGSSGLAASEVNFRFMRIGIDIDSTSDSDVMRMQAAFQDENSLILAFSISGEKKGILYFLREAHKRGAKTVMITANNNDVFSDFCDEVVLIPSLNHLNHGNFISPQFPFLVMMDIIYSYQSQLDKFKKEIMHDTTIKALEENEK